MKFSVTVRTKNFLPIDIQFGEAEMVQVRTDL